MRLKIHHLRTENEIKVTMTYASGAESQGTVNCLLTFLKEHGMSRDELTIIKSILLREGECLTQ
jgi:hypothetical protein